MLNCIQFITVKYYDAIEQLHFGVFFRYLSFFGKKFIINEPKLEFVIFSLFRTCLLLLKFKAYREKLHEAFCNKCHENNYDIDYEKKLFDGNWTNICTSIIFCFESFLYYFTYKRKQIANDSFFIHFSCDCECRIMHIIIDPSFWNTVVICIVNNIIHSVFSFFFWFFVSSFTGKISFIVSFFVPFSRMKNLRVSNNKWTGYSLTTN